MSPAKLVNSDIHMKFVTEDKFTEVTPKKSKNFSTQYSKSEVIDEHVQTSPVRDLNWFSECIFKENLKVDQHSQMSDSFVERSLDIDTKERKSNLFHQSSQTSPLNSRNDSKEKDYTINDVFINNSINAPKNADVCGCGYFSDETKILIKKVSDIKYYTCNIFKNCTKTEYLKDADEYLSDVNDCCSKSSLETVTDLENLISILGYYVSNRDQDCEIINNELESKFQEANSLESELCEVKRALDKRESELSSLSNLFFDLKQNFSQLTFIHQVLNNVDSQEKLNEIRGNANISIPLQSCKLEYEMTKIKNYFVKLNSYIEKNESKIISLSEELKKVKSELAAAKKEDFRLFESSCVSKNTVSKGIQTCQVLSETTEKDKILADLNKERNDLLERISYLEEQNKALKKDIDDLYNSDSERIEILKSDITNTWKIKTELLVKDLEQKYDQELVEQEKNFAEELRIKVKEVKQDNLKQLQELKEEIEEMKLSHCKELSVIKKQYEDQFDSVSTEKQELMHQLENEHEKKISGFKEKYVAKQKEFKKVYSELNVRLQHYMEEVEKLKNERTPSNQLQVIEKLKEKINDLSDERDMLQKKCTRSDLQISELKEHNNYLKHELKKNDEESKQSTLTKLSKLENTNKELMYDLDQKKAKIMTLQFNNASMLQELKKLKDMQSSKTCTSCKNKHNSKELNSDVSEKGDRKNKMICKDDLDEQEKTTAKQKVTDENSTPLQKDYLNNRTPDQNSILCVGGGSGPANMVKSYWLEGMLHKKDKEIQKLREELGDLKSQLKTKKLQPLINEERQPEVKEKVVKKQEVAKTSISPLQEVDENITVQLKTLHPYHGGAIPRIPKKHASRDKNGGLTSSKPYDKQQKVERIRKENIAWQQPVNPNNNICEPKTKSDVVNQLTDPECRQQ